MKPLLRLSAVFLLGSLPFASVVAAQQHPGMPAGMTHEQHMAQMKKEAEMKQHGQMAMGAIHDFLRYQIREHATSDPVSVQK